MNQFKFIIIEDEYPAQQILLKHLEKFPEFECLGVYTNVLDNEFSEKLSFADLLFLDINLPSMDGLSFLKIKNPTLDVILTTAYSEYSLESYNYNVMDYLLKPIRFERFFQTIEKFKKRNKLEAPIQQASIVEKENKIFIKSDKEIHPIDTKDILYIESLKDYVRIHLVDKKIIHHRNLKYWEENLHNTYLIRIHQSYMINLKKIAKIHANAVEIEHKILPIGRKYKVEFESYKNAIKLH